MGKSSLHRSILFVTLLGFLLYESCFGLNCEYFNLTECPDPNVQCNSPKTVTCTSDDPTSHTLSCFALWQRGANSDEPEMLRLKGCFINNKDCLGMESCVDRNRKGQKYSKNSTTHTHYCCCETDLCNRDYVWEPKNETNTPVKENCGNRKKWCTRMGWVVVLVASFCILCVIVVFLVHRRVQQKPLPTSTSNLTDEENILLDKSESNHVLSPVELIEPKANGRFGSVWKGTMVGQPDWVAVKILPLREKTSWRLEQEVYSLPLMCDSKLILGYFGARTDPESMQLWLISEYITNGSLYDYMKGHELSWNEVLQVALTMCQGLAFLHDEIDAGVLKGVKPAVAHRDFKSKNVLLRPDLTACIADFGLAHIFYPSKLVGTNHGQVGTRRYMAPEVLDGAVSFTRDNFQRIDMYACGLVLWELATRCSAQQGPVGEYRLPFEEHVGQQPTLEEMIECVVTQRKRPTLRNDWLSHSGLAVMSEAVKEAWDQDAEARISASCIVERLHSISNKIIN